MQRSVLEYLERTAARLPDKPAFVDSRSTLTFAQLLQAARAIGSALCPIAPLRGFVAVLCDRTAISVAGFLGALAAGCCYVPVDAKLPPARRDAILAQVEPAAIVYARRDEAIAAALPWPALCLEDAMGTPPDEAALAARREAVLDLDPAYVIFTSGSTGTPKGIAVPHRAVIDFTEWLGQTVDVGEADVLGNQAPFYFDLSVKDLYTGLRTGATVHILPKTFFSFPKLLSAYLTAHGVTTLFWATSAFRLIASSGLMERDPPRTVRRVILGGEALQAAHLRRWQDALPEARFWNLYGPTEVTVDCTCFPITRRYRDDEPIPIGRACRNMEVILLDEDLRPVAPGEVGEICVRGSGLALGYLGDWEKTASAFIQDPRNTRYPDRLYRTGDLARCDKDGNLLFLSRRDGQIKHMGYRIELGEVETAVGAIPGVDACACLFDRERDQILCFCQTRLTPDALAIAAQGRLPKYMTPNLWRTEQRLPANANGKIDRAKLKELYFAQD